jgi:hypothetical protein
VVRGMIAAEDLHELEQLVVGDVVALAPDSPAHPVWIVQARDARFLVLSRPSDLDANTQIYTIADLAAGVRGPCNLIGGGWDMTDPAWADKLLRALNSDLQVTEQLNTMGGPVSLAEIRVRVSERNNVPLALAHRKTAR